jgi:hypothetical protein
MLGNRSGHEVGNSYNTPCGYQEHSPTLLIPYPIFSTEIVDEKQILLLPIWYA